eukprot:393034_1
MSDSGNFTKCICNSFGRNLAKMIKLDFNTLIVEIGCNLENETNHAELCNISGTLRFNQIRFERCKTDASEKATQIEMVERKQKHMFGCKQVNYSLTNGHFTDDEDGKMEKQKEITISQNYKPNVESTNHVMDNDIQITKQIDNITHDTDSDANLFKSDKEYIKYCALMINTDNESDGEKRYLE